MIDFTVKRLKELLKDVPDDTVVYYQKIDDHYFENSGWETTEMRFDDKTTSDYIKAFSAQYHPEDKAFCVNAHY